MIFYSLNRDSVVVARLELRRYNNTYQVRASVVNDGTSWSNSAWFTITDAPHKLEIDWRASSAPGANNGGITFWVDDVQRGSFTNIDNDTRKVDYVQWGAVSGVDSGTRGAYYFDDFVSRRQSYIGMLNTPGRALAQDGLPGSAKVHAAPPPVKLPSPPVDLPQGDVVFAPLEQGQAISVTTVITYTYDPLDRLIAADYSDGRYVHFAYDAVGNRLHQEMNGSTTDYYYDNANRLYQVINWEHGNYDYEWDDNGNLLNDGANTYSYDHANRLTAFSGAQTAVGYAYNGLGDRISQTAGITTTNYTLDLATSLTQVLADGTNTYLYGLSRIGEQQPAGWQYHLGDALSSARQLTDAAGAVTLSRRYEPYGELFNSIGSAVTSYGFAGEWTDNYIEMVYLRARWYAPYLKQFIQHDPIVSDYTNPQSLNAYSYVLNNPVNLTDPSGLSPIVPQEPPDHRDLTYWLYEEMSENANGYYAQRIQSLLNGSNLTQKARAVFGWIFLVKDRAKWDSKHKIRDFTGGKSVLLHSDEGPAWYDYSVPGNIHYGFVGRASGFSGFMLHTGAGYAEITDPAHKERGEACCPKYCKDLVDDSWVNLTVSIQLGCYYINPDWASTLFDDPSDYWNVEFGVRLYDSYGSRMSYEQFQNHLATSGYWLTPASLIPETRFEHPDWPYSVGNFDGPDTAKNKPIVDLLLWRSPFGD